MRWVGVDVWLPDRAPERRDVVSGGVCLVLIGGLLAQESAVAWPWAVVGFVFLAVIPGPLADTRVGQRVDAWGQALHPVWKVVVTVVVALAMMGVLVVVGPPRAYLGFTFGALVAVVVVLSINAVYHRVG